MNQECLDFIAACVEQYPAIRGDVLEVGSYDVNGNPRHIFNDRLRFPSYLGIDMRSGPCVDRRMNTHNLTFPSSQFDVIVDAERLEHDEQFWRSYQELYRVTRPGAHVIITTRSWGGFGPHSFPADYWRFMDFGLKALLEQSGFECLHTEYAEPCEAQPGSNIVGFQGVYAIGRKPA